MMTTLAIIVIVLVVCVGVLFRKVAKLSKPLSDKETWERNQALKKDIATEVEKQLQLVEKKPVEDENEQTHDEILEQAVREVEEKTVLIDFELTKEIDKENVAVATFIDDKENDCYSVLLDEGESLPEGLHENYPKSVWPKEHIISVLSEEGWKLAAEAEQPATSNQQPATSNQ